MKRPAPGCGQRAGSARRRPALRCLGSCAAAAALTAGCVFGPGQLQRGQLAYNRAVKSAADEELLLNVVRLRYLDTLDFMATTSISSQLSLALSAGARGGSDTQAGGMGALGQGEIAYSTRPTFTLTPQRGREFAQQLIEPVSVDILAYLIASDWDAKMLFRLLVRSLNGLDNELGVENPEFKQLTDRLAALQMLNQLVVGFVSETRSVAGPIEAKGIDVSDIVEAARAGFQLRQATKGGPIELTAQHTQPVLSLKPGSEDAETVLRLLRLRPGQPYYDLQPGTHVEAPTELLESIDVRMGSLLRSIIYLSQGVGVPPEHVAEGLTTREFPPGSPGSTITDIFEVHFSKRRPDAQLAVKHRGYWFYLRDEDLASRYTFFHMAELVRLGLAPGAAQPAPVLTLPVGG